MCTLQKNVVGACLKCVPGTKELARFYQLTQCMSVIYYRGPHLVGFIGPVLQEAHSQEPIASCTQEKGENNLSAG